MDDVLKRLSYAIERGKIDRESPHPPDMRNQDGADELTCQALGAGIAPSEILSNGLVPGMQAIGEKFARNEVFIPDILLSARAMTKATEHLKPYFQSGDIKLKGTFIVGTVQGDLHDIGKKIVSMVIEGGGWKVIDLGVDVSAQKFADAVRENPGCAVGLSALLTTTMSNMQFITKKIKSESPSTIVIIGGAPITREFASRIGSDGYFADPQGALNFLNSTNKIGLTHK
jgi:5-methyltetrahydrofolate--homocysteine methyltransferase